MNNPQTIRLPREPEEGIPDEQSLRNIIAQLCSQSSSVVESETLEIKSWCQNEKQFGDKASEASACLANAFGGIVLLGIGDEESDLTKFSNCPYKNVRSEWISQRIQDSTVPPVEMSVCDIGKMVRDISGLNSIDAYAIFVPRSRRIGGHQTVGGLSKIRSGKECRPYYLAEDDRTKAPVPTAALSDLSLVSIEWGLDQHEKRFRTGNQWETPYDFLSHIGLVEKHTPDIESTPRYRVTLAGLLLFGKETALSRYFPGFETILITREGPKRIQRNIVETFRELCGSKSSLLPELCPKISLQTLRELVVNAFIHRSYRVTAPFIIRIEDERLEIESPGQLPVGLNAENLIHCTPVYRNFLLAEGARYLGICDKIGKGIDVVYQQVVSSGFGFPTFESRENRFVARVPLKESGEFSEFVARRSQVLTNLDEMIILRVLFDREKASANELFSAIQRGKQHGIKILEEMLRKLIIEPIDGSSMEWRLTPTVRMDIRNVFSSDQIHLDFDLFGET